MENWIGNLLSKLVGKSLDNYKTTIGAVCTLLYLVVVVYGKLWPEHAIMQGVDMSWEQLFGNASEALTGLGLMHKAYKAGLVTPVPESPMTTTDDAPKMG